MANAPRAGRVLAPAMAAALPAGFSAALAIFATFALAGQNLLLWSCLIAAAALVVWSLVLYSTARRSGRTLGLSVSIYRHHWVQALAQATVYAWWGWHVRLVYAFLPLILAQILFAYAVEALLAWSRRNDYSIGFGPLPVVGSINLFLWFRPEWFFLQFVLIAVGYVGKELIRWQKDERSAHIFNPSSLPLSIAAVILIALGASDITFGGLIANSQHDPPAIYLVIFLAALPGQILFGVARTTLAAVLALVLFGATYFAVTGTYFFYDSYVPVPVFLGMLLLVTDPSTSPRTELGRLGFGVLYAAGILGLYIVLSRAGIPTFYDKLLPVPLLNLSVRALDRLASRGEATAKATGSSRHRAWAIAWAIAFAALLSVQAVGDRHPGQYLPFWNGACESGSARACDYASFLTLAYCNNGSGWACNEAALDASARGESVAELLSRGCALGFEPACANAARTEGRAAEWERAPPRIVDLPVVLRGTKPVLRERDPQRLIELACGQGWNLVCATTD